MIYPELYKSKFMGLAAVSLLALVSIHVLVSYALLPAIKDDSLSFVEPVSYTHLDVYKRQLPHCVEGDIVSISEDMAIHEHQITIGWAHALIEAEQGVGPVRSQPPIGTVGVEFDSKTGQPLGERNRRVGIGHMVWWSRKRSVEINATHRYHIRQ